MKNKKISKIKVAKIAIDIERKILREEGGIQDQIAASYGGINFIKCFKNYNFSVKKISLNKNKIKFLENNLLLIFSNIKDIHKIIKSQTNNKINIYEAKRST